MVNTTIYGDSGDSVHQDDVVSFISTINPGPVKFKILKRIPRGSKVVTAKKLGEILSCVTSSNDNRSWERLISFSRMCLAIPIWQNKRASLISSINRAVNEEKDPLQHPHSQPQSTWSGPPWDASKVLAYCVASEL